MPIHAPNENPAIQQLRPVLIDYARSSADAASDSSPWPWSNELAALDAAEVEPQHRKVPVHEGVVELVDDLVAHRPAELRVRMQNDGDRRVLCRAGW
jgi:hypothetical protein